MKHVPVTLALMLILVICEASVAATLVHNQEEYRQAVQDAKAGDTIMLADGEWRDFEILFAGAGEAGKPITLTAETKGKVILSGQSNLRLAGHHLVVSGLVFRDGYSPTNTVISFRRTRGEYAYHSQVTEVVIDHFTNQDRHETDFWVVMYGRNNHLNHNHFSGKSNKGVTMAVRLDSVESQENHHVIDHNYFGPRPILGSNGGETLRIGTSKYSLTDSFTVVENNYFDRCNGEVEIISSKSGSNIFRGNVFFESRGTLTLRHGNNNLIENNVFLGNGKRHTGGIRVINKGQTIRNNYLQGLTGKRFGAGFAIMNGVPNSPINRYHQVEDAVIEHNTFIAASNIELATGSDEERSATPQNSTFRNNLIVNEDGKNNFNIYDDISGITFEDNITNTKKVARAIEGTRYQKVELKEADNGLLYPASRKLKDVGVSRNLRVISRDDTGVSWYPKPDQRVQFGSGSKISILPSDSFDAAIISAKPGDTVMLAPGEYIASRIQVINRPITVRSANPNQRATIQFERSSLFQIASGGSLELADLKISGKLAPDMIGNSVIRISHTPSIGNYELIVRNILVQDLTTNHSFNFMTASRHTFADTILIEQSAFEKITGHVLSLNAETEDLGIYNGEYITLSGNRFTDIAGTVADVYRGGTDESTFGPQVELLNSTIERVGRGKRNNSGASVNLFGAQRVVVKGNTLIDSGGIRNVETTGEPKISITGNTFRNTPSETQVK